MREDPDLRQEETPASHSKFHISSKKNRCMSHLCQRRVCTELCDVKVKLVFGGSHKNIDFVIRKTISVTFIADICSVSIKGLMTRLFCVGEWYVTTQYWTSVLVATTIYFRLRGGQIYIDNRKLYTYAGQQTERSGRFYTVIYNELLYSNGIREQPKHGTGWQKYCVSLSDRHELVLKMEQEFEIYK